MSLSFVHVQPGQKATAASKHKERVGIHSHAQKVTQQRKRQKRLEELEKKAKTSSGSAGRVPTARQSVIQRLSSHQDASGLINAVNLGKRYPYGIPTPSPEPDPQVTRPLTDYSSWTDDHKYGVSMFVHVTVLDINENATNMIFWKEDVPALSNFWPCIRDIVSAIAAANQAIQDRDSNLILTALELHLKALARLRRDVGMLPLSAQVACCLLFDAFNLLRCEFAVAGDQVAVARRLTSNLPLEAYLQDEKLPSVCDALNKMEKISVWSLWNPSNFLQYEGLRHIEPNLYLELQPIDTTNGILQGLVETIGRLSKQCCGRIRRNLSETAFIDPLSRFAHDVLGEFRVWRAHFDALVAHQISHEDRATVQQAEVAWNFQFIMFTGGVLNCGEMVYDDPRYTSHWNRINDIAERRFAETADLSRQTNIKAFMHITLPTLWHMVLSCRDPKIRARTISILESRQLQEGEYNSIVIAKMARTIVDLETQGAAIRSAADIPSHCRICVEKIGYRVETEEAILSYSFPNQRGRGDVTFETSIPWKLEGDLTKLTSAIFALSQVCTLYRKVRPSAAPSGYIKPMYYENEAVPVRFANPGA